MKKIFVRTWIVGKKSSSMKRSFLCYRCGENPATLYYSLHPPFTRHWLDRRKHHTVRTTAVVIWWQGLEGGGGGWDREGGRDLRSNFNMQSSSTGLFLIIFFSLIQVLLSWTQYFPFLKMFNIIFTVSFTSQSWFLQPSKFDCV